MIDYRKQHQKVYLYNLDNSIYNIGVSLYRDTGWFSTISRFSGVLVNIVKTGKQAYMNHDLRYIILNRDMHILCIICTKIDSNIGI